MSQTNIVRYRIEFLSTHTGLGWMEVDTSNMTVVRILLDDETDVSHDGMSYRTIVE